MSACRVCRCLACECCEGCAERDEVIEALTAEIERLKAKAPKTKDPRKACRWCGLPVDLEPDPYRDRMRAHWWHSDCLREKVEKDRTKRNAAARERNARRRATEGGT